MNQYIKNTKVTLTDITKLSEARVFCFVENETDLQALEKLSLASHITSKIHKLYKEKKDIFETFYVGSKEIEYITLACYFGSSDEKCIYFLGSKLSNFSKKDVTIFCSESRKSLLLDTFYLGFYSFQDYKSEKSKVHISIISSQKDYEKEMQSRLESLENVIFCRDLGETPASDLSPESFVKRAEKIGWKHTKTKVLSPKDIEKKRLGMLYAVGKGSQNKPYMLILEHIVDKKLPTIALIGKGVVFDTGGLNLKLGDGMFEMKQDMNGAATVLSVMKELDRYKELPVNIVAAIPLAENSVSGESFRPSDIITAYTGQTVQITNTDAEGRLILGDAVGYISTNYDVESIISVATLTGACVHALGFRYAGVMGTDRKIIDALKSWGENSLEKYNELPFDDYFIEKTKSKIADLDNWSGGVKAGPTMGAAFIANFLTKNELYTHIDIAGVSINSFEPYGYVPKGATGFGVMSLSELLKNYK